MSKHKLQMDKLREAALEQKNLTTAEAAALTGYTTDHIGLMLRKGSLKGIKRGRDWFVYAQSLLDYAATSPHPGRKGIT